MYAPCTRNRVLRKIENGKRQMANLQWICSRKKYKSTLCKTICIRKVFKRWKKK